MSYKDKDLKRLFARSQNQCAMPKCTAPIVVGDVVVGEICHIKARRKNGPRYDPTLTLSQRNAYGNLLLLCRTCHKLIDSNRETYSVELLDDLKEMQESQGGMELNSGDRRSVALLIESLKQGNRSKASATSGGVALSIGGDNNGNITINQKQSSTPPKSKSPANSIGSDANLSGYIDYLFGLAVEYWDGVPKMDPGRLGKKIKSHFRLKLRTRNHLAVDRFEVLSDFIIREMLAPSPAGKRHLRNGTRLCRTFEEWRSGLS